MDRQLAALAAQHGVATWYEDSRRERVAVSAETVVSVLGLLDVDATTPDRIAEALASARASAKSRLLPPTIVLRSGAGRPLPGSGVVTTEDGERIDVGDALPGDLPLGWHRLVCGEQDVTLVVVPRRLPAAAPTWGWMLQLYALHSADSWGMGDLADLASLTRWAGDRDTAGLILLNPLHAVGPTHPVPASPYSPTSRRFVNPLYLSVTDTAAFRAADADLADRVIALRPPVGTATDLIDYDAVWSAKLAALELLFPLAGPIDLDADPDVTSFATYCALAERHGSDWRAWPPELRAPGGDSVVAAAKELADRIAFFVWLQRLCAEQLATVASAAHETGMPVGIVHDLAVGVDPGGADGWMLGDVLATRARVGAPPDAFNQLGQDWGLAAWRPDRLAETGYAALPGPASTGTEPCRRPTRRSCRRSVPAVVDPAGRGRYRGHVRSLRRRRDARHPGAGGGAGRSGRDRRGPRHRTAGGVEGPTVAEHARVDGGVVRARLGPARQPVPPTRSVAA